MGETQMSSLPGSRGCIRHPPGTWQPGGKGAHLYRLEFSTSNGPHDRRIAVKVATRVAVEHGVPAVELDGGNDRRGSQLRTVGNDQPRVQKTFAAALIASTECAEGESRHAKRFLSVLCPTPSAAERGTARRTLLTGSGNRECY